MNLATLKIGANTARERKCAYAKAAGTREGCDECQEDHVNPQQCAGAQGPAKIPPLLHDVIQSAGCSLTSQTRAFFEERFGYDFSRVRVHTDSKAAESARMVNALAYTAGEHIIFAQGHHTPESNSGKKLMAHELTHVIQNNRHPQTSPVLRRQPGPATPGRSKPWDELPPKAQNKIDQTYYNEGLSPASREAFRAVFKAMSDEGLWEDVVHVTNAFPEHVRGIDAVVKPSFYSLLVSNPRFCRDTAGEEALSSIIPRLRGKRVPVPEPKWRQVVQHGTEGLHIIGHGLVNRVATITAHLDTVAPVAGRDSGGECLYSAPDIIPHALRDLKGQRNVELFPVPREAQKGDVQPAVKFRIPGT